MNGGDRKSRSVLNGGVIGFGRMGITHFSILNTHPSVKFSAICDSSRAMLKVVGKHLKLRTYSDYQKMVDDAGFDFVVISTPTGQHAEQVQYCLNRNIHVFVEKPFTLGPTQSQEVLEILAVRPVVNQVGYVNRYNEVFALVREMVREGDLGDLFSFKVEIHSPTVLKGQSSGWREKRSEGGGCLYDMAAHGIDLVNFIIGPPHDVTGSVLRSIHSLGVEDTVSSTLLYADGLFGNLFVNWSDPSCRKPTYKIDIFGKAGRAIADQHAVKVFFREEPERDGFNRDWNVRYITDIVEPVRFYLRGYEFTRQLDSFVDDILTSRGANRSSFVDAAQTDEVIRMIARDAGHLS